jgi:hypothetical protein
MGREKRYERTGNQQINHFETEKIKACAQPNQITDHEDAYTQPRGLPVGAVLR